MRRAAGWLGRHWWLVVSLLAIALVANQLIGQAVAQLASGR